MALVRKMICDLWNEDYSENIDLIMIEPTVEQAVESAQKLDSSRRTLVILELDDQRSLMIGGGGGNYFLSATMAKDVFFVLHNRCVTEGSIELMVGGQEGDYPRAQVVGDDQMKEAIRHYCESGQIDDSCSWKKA